MKTKDRLEKFILENRDAFDMYEPGPEVWKRISRRENVQKTRRFLWGNIVWKAAAAVAIFIGSYFFYKMVGSPQIENAGNIIPGSEKNIVIPELAEAEGYYNQMVSLRMNEISQYASIYPDIEQEIRVDLTELDSICAELKKDLKDNIDNEEIINAMIHNYRLKLKVLEDILEYIRISDENENSHEKIRHEI
ncbi:MAG: hypothetical protein KJ607_13670 [Bacteroidetes bacterium]|nr:hypothetical protein [Bacteroidota bacterium]